MAKIKFEFLAQYHDVHGIPFRARLFGNIGRIARLSSGPLAPLANLGLRSRLVRMGMEKLIGISARRSLPAFARTSFEQWFARRPRVASGDGSPRQQVVLLNDPFYTYNYPEVAIAATEVLEAAGFEVLLAGVKDDGRPFISKGMVTQARAAARATVDRLVEFADQGLPIVGLEPSSLLTLRDEYLYLLPDDSDARSIANHAFTFEEFIARLADEGGLNLHFSQEPRQILLHGHCHQKALVGTAPSLKILALPENYTVTEVDSGCCGMAGSFGYETEHYEISMQMAERRLLPAVRQAGEATLIVAAGVSCRQQIKHGTGRQAWHPAEVLRAALV
jgi:Fe-S oxidoreductase